MDMSEILDNDTIEADAIEADGATVEAAENTAAPETTATKERKPYMRKKLPLPYSPTLPDGTRIDLTSGIFEGVKLTDKQKLFIFWYTYPDNEAYHKAPKAAQKAGYSETTAYNITFTELKNPEIQKLIKQVDDFYTKISLEDAYRRFIQQKIDRAEFCIDDYYDIDTITNKKGDEVTMAMIKPLEDLTDEQKRCIDGITYVGANNIPMYVLPNREKEINSIIDLYTKQNAQAVTSEYDVQTTLEVIKDNLKIRTQIITANKEITDIADVKKEAANTAQED